MIESAIPVGHDGGEAVPGVEERVEQLDDERGEEEREMRPADGAGADRAAGDEFDDQHDRRERAEQETGGDQPLGEVQPHELPLFA